jgi:hypothetical protein
MHKTIAPAAAALFECTFCEMTGGAVVAPSVLAGSALVPTAVACTTNPRGRSIAVSVQGSEFLLH